MGLSFPHLGSRFRMAPSPCVQGKVGLGIKLFAKRTKRTSLEKWQNATHRHSRTATLADENKDVMLGLLCEYRHLHKFCSQNVHIGVVQMGFI